MLNGLLLHFAMTFKAVQGLRRIPTDMANDSLGKCLPIQGTCIPYSSYGPLWGNTKLIIGVPGLKTTSKEFVAALVMGLEESSCSADTLIISPELPKSSSYNEIGKAIVENLTLEMILDEFTLRFKPISNNILYFGFSKGGQAIQRYSLIQTANPGAAYIYGCKD